jgi:hypothetical protein
MSKSLVAAARANGEKGWSFPSTSAPVSRSFCNLQAVSGSLFGSPKSTCRDAISSRSAGVGRAILTPFLSRTTRNCPYQWSLCYIS